MEKNPYQSFQTLAAGIAKAGASDRPSSEDKLGFAPYVFGVADFLTDSGASRPVTISVEGEWGSGKTSFLLQLGSELRARGAATVWFSGWRCEDEQTLWASMVLQIVDSLESDLGNWWKKDWAEIRLRWSRFDFRKAVPRLLVGTGALIAMLWVLSRLLMAMAENPQFYRFVFDGQEPALSFVLGATGAVGIGLSLALAARWLWWNLGSPLSRELNQFLASPDYLRNEAKLAAVHRDLPKILSAYAGEKPVFVLVDDLDRAEPPHGAKLVQALNQLMQDTSQVNYVLALDRDKVAAGLAVTYEKVIPYLTEDLEHIGGVRAGLRFGWEFLEKFVQLSFRLPRADEKFLKGMFSTESFGDTTEIERGQALVEITEEADGDAFLETIMLVAPSLGFNPRRVKQFANAFRLKAHIASRTGLFMTKADQQPLTLERLGKWVAIQQRWPAVLDQLERNPRYLEDLFTALIDPDGGPHSVDRDLQRLLLAPHADAGSWSVADHFRFGMNDLDVEALMKISGTVTSAPSREEAPSDLELDEIFGEQATAS